MLHQLRFSRRSAARSLAALLVPFSFGCSDGASSSSSGLGEGDAYVVATRVWDDSSTTSYFHVVPSLTAGTQIDVTRALEVPGAAKLYSIEDAGWLAVGGGEDPTITRLALANDGTLEMRDRISLQPYGVRSLWDTLYVVSPEKMYYPDRDNQQLLIINPSALIIEGTVPLPQTARPGYLSLYGYAPIRRGDQLLISVGWFDWEAEDRVLGETGLVVLDTRTDEVVRFDVDTRCGGITQPVTLPSGDTYLLSSALAGAAHRLGRLPTEPCALRITADADTFDATYLTRLAELTSRPIAGEPVPTGGDAIYLRVLDEQAAEIAEDSATYDLTGQALWSWWRWDVPAGSAAPVPGLAPSTADVLWVQVDGRVYGTETTEDYSTTTLLDLGAEASSLRALTAPGFMHAVAKIR